MLDATKPLISSDELKIYDDEIKNYIKNQGIGLTTDDVEDIVNSLDTNTTYTLSKSEGKITLTGSDESVTEINEQTEILATTEPSTQNVGDFLLLEY